MWVELGARRGRFTTGCPALVRIFHEIQREVRRYGVRLPSAVLPPLCALPRYFPPSHSTHDLSSQRYGVRLPSAVLPPPCALPRYLPPLHHGMSRAGAHLSRDPAGGTEVRSQAPLRRSPAALRPAALPPALALDSRPLQPERLTPACVPMGVAVLARGTARTRVERARAAEESLTPYHAESGSPPPFSTSSCTVPR